MCVDFGHDDLKSRPTCQYIICCNFLEQISTEPETVYNLAVIIVTFIFHTFWTLILIDTSNEIGEEVDFLQLHLLFPYNSILRAQRSFDTTWYFQLNFCVIKGLPVNILMRERERERERIAQITETDFYFLCNYLIFSYVRKVVRDERYFPMRK